MKQITGLLLVLAALTSNALCSEEEFVSWKTVTIESVEHPQTGVVTISASTDGTHYKWLIIAAFGKKEELTEYQLSKLEGFPLSSSVLTHEAGYENLGGHTVHLKLLRTYYDSAAKVLKTDEVIISLPKTSSVKLTKRTLP